MRRLLWFTVGFAVAAVLFAYWVSGTTILLLASICLLLVFLLMIANTRFRIPAILLLGCSLGLLYSWGYDRVILSTARAYDGKTLEAAIEITDYAEKTEYGYRVNGKICLEQREYPLCAYFSSQEDVKPGDVFSGTVTLRYTPEGGEKPTTFHKGEGRFLIAYLEKNIRLHPAKEIPFSYFPAVLRKNLSQQITQIFPEDTAAFSKALLLGEDGDISFSDNIAFQKSGIRHVIAVSGLHVSILFSMVYFVTGRRRFLSLILGLPVLFIFSAVAGFSPSVMRACLMQALMLMAAVLNKEYDPGTALSFAVLMMLLLNPLTITSVSFQLSVGCMAGIFLFSGHIQKYLRKRLPFENKKGIWLRLRGWLIGSVSVSVSAMSVTLPLCAFYFGTVGVVGILTNLVTLWLIPYIFIGIMVACAGSYIYLPLGTGLAFLISFPERYVLTCAKWLSKLPLGTLYTQSPYTVLWVVAVCGLLILFLLLKKKPVVLFAVSVAALYFMAAGFSILEPYFHKFEATVVDVGQGQCVILQSKSRVYMVDCGSKDGENAATAALQALGTRGIHKLDGLIVTHFDSDHCNGAPYLMDCVQVDTLYLPNVAGDDPYRKVLTEKGVPVVWVDETKKLTHPTGEIQIFPPENAGEGNESSLSILFRSGTYDILITGDLNQEGETLLLRQEDIPDLEVLVVGHHGAKTSTGVALLNHTKPELAVISVGTHNPYGHPHSETIKRLQLCGCRVRRTDLEGTIIIRG